MLEGLIESIASKFGLNPAQAAGIVKAITQRAQSNPQGLMEGLQSNGLGAQLSSWIGGGENQPIAAEHTDHALGADFADSTAQEIGVDPQIVREASAHALPEIVNDATPDGVLPEGGLQGALGGIMGKLGGLDLGGLLGGGGGGLRRFLC
ncbi:MAG: YidB family protein, partial [Fimbriimonadaceae bacterium]